MGKKVTFAVGCFGYAQFVFVAEIFLALYWLCVLTYASVHDHKKLLAGLIFGLHYAGLIALSALFDEITKEKNGVIPYGKTRYTWRSPYTTVYGRGSPQHNIKVIKINNDDPRRSAADTGDDSAGENDGTEGEGVLKHGVFATGPENAITERNLSEKLTHYPLSYGVALFVAMISDLFSLVDAILDHEISKTTYYLYIVLFAIGLCLTTSSIIWSFVFYSQMSVSKKATNKTEI